MIRLCRGIPVLLLSFGMLASAQTAPSAAQGPIGPQKPAAAAPSPAAKAGKPAAPAASLSPQQQRLLDEADQLLDLAQKLKVEVDKTNQYTLSLNTLRRADDIDKLAKTLEKQVEREAH